METKLRRKKISLHLAFFSDVAAASQLDSSSSQRNRDQRSSTEVATRMGLSDCPPLNDSYGKSGGKEVVSISSEILKEVTRDCEKLVVGYFIGKRRSFSEVQFAIANTSKMEAEKCASGPKERLKQLYMLPTVLLRHRVHLVRMGDIGDHPYPRF
ncbi:uncharacterized protein LOC113324809 [Papaver somniferum]|uniref:uncharacterized protein LOC113324809 n=1 Tax=Papaver somniferum TaxID=3469 RepID=UPI000E70484E|nr:uncharacterized protein LOC113324809 [Papaver somniferum]